MPPVRRSRFNAVLRRIVGPLAPMLVMLGLALVLSPSAAAGVRAFPVPTCKWTSGRLVSRTFRTAVRAPRAKWSTEFAPVLSCGYRERRPKLQARGADLVKIQYRELQYFHVEKGWQRVPHLGSCVKRRSCPAAHAPAWIDVRTQSTTKASSPKTASPSSAAAVAHIASAPRAASYISGVTLYVEDGLNCIVISIDNPKGRLSVRNEIAHTEALARRLLARFHWV